MYFELKNHLNLYFWYYYALLKNNYNSNNVNISNSENIINNESKTVILQTPEDKSFSMSVIGDIMCHNTQFKDAYSNGSYDFSYVFTDIKDYIQSSDISIGNLETTFAGSEKRIWWISRF